MITIRMGRVRGPTLTHTPTLIRLEPGSPSFYQSRQIRDVFAQRLMPVHRQIRERMISVILCGQRLAGRLEMLEIFLRPPVGEPAVRIELAPLIVEAVTDFMTDDRPHRSVIMSG